MHQGTIGWIDLTVENAESTREFYQHVIGWEKHPVAMEGYDDYAMLPPGADVPVAGICHARGPNEDLPPVWLVYFVVEDLSRSLHTCENQGGKIVHGPKELGGDKFCVIQDPSGAVCALYEKGPQQ